VIESPARIRRTEGDTAWVISEAPASCGACHGKGCGSSVFARFWHADAAEYPVENHIGAQAGDAVIVGLPEGALLHAALASYIFPLFSLLGCAALGVTFGGEPGAMIGGLFGLLAAALWLRRSSRLRIWPHPAANSTPVILRRGSGGGCKNS